MTFVDNDKSWIKANYPELTLTNDEISGVVDVLATYNPESRMFLDLKNTTVDAVGGIRLSGNFSIMIAEREMSERAFSDLPKVIIDGILAQPERHINPTDKSACLCSPLEEESYLYPTFQIAGFFEKLLIPFLYGQIFYDSFKSWPWPDYGHGAIGILESYNYLSDPIQAATCLKRLSTYKDSQWAEIKILLAKRGNIKGHSICICQTKEKIRNCHERALLGLRKLQHDIKSQNLIIPD